MKDQRSPRLSAEWGAKAPANGASVARHDWSRGGGVTQDWTRPSSGASASPIHQGTLRASSDGPMPRTAKEGSDITTRPGPPTPRGAQSPGVGSTQDWTRPSAAAAAMPPTHSAQPHTGLDWSKGAPDWSSDEAMARTERIGHSSVPGLVGGGCRSPLGNESSCHCESPGQGACGGAKGATDTRPRSARPSSNAALTPWHEGTAGVDAAREMRGFPRTRPSDRSRVAARPPESTSPRPIGAGPGGPSPGGTSFSKACNSRAEPHADAGGHDWARRVVGNEDWTRPATRPVISVQEKMTTERPGGAFVRSGHERSSGVDRFPRSAASLGADDSLYRVARKSSDATSFCELPGTCTPVPPAPAAPTDVNVVWPPDGASDFTRRYASSEPSLVFLPEHNVGGTTVPPRLVMGFNDEEGVFANSPDGRQDRYVFASIAGVAYSTDFGLSWHRSPRQLLLDTFCIQFPGLCDLPADLVAPEFLGGARPPHDRVPAVQTLVGDPSLATNGGVVLYANLSHHLRDPLSEQPNAIAVARSTDGINWTFPRYVAIRSDVPDKDTSVDKPNVAFIGSTAVVTYTEMDEGTIHIVTSDDEGESWSEPTLLAIDTYDRVQEPRVVLTTPTTGYIAFAKVPDATFGFGVAYISRTSSDSSEWIATTLQKVDHLKYQPSVSGVGGFERHPKTWRDAYPMSFDVGHIDTVFGTGHLYVAYRDQDEGLSIVRLLHCADDVTHTACAGAEGWHRRTMNPALWERFDQFQPVVAAERLGPGVAVSWYQWTSIESGIGNFLSVRGRKSPNAGHEFGPIQDLHPSGPPWLACPSLANLAGYYGDYIASVVLPNSLPGTPPYVVTAYSDSSGGCLSPSDTPGLQQTFDQHVQAAVW